MKRITEGLKNRKSVRTFERRSIDRLTLDQLRQEIDDTSPLYEHINIRFEIIEGKEAVKKLEGKSGYFGKVFEAPNYLLAISETKEGYEENVGYQTEQILLKAQNLGLGTCWIAIIPQHEERIRQSFSLKQCETLVAVSPLGYEKEEFATKLLKKMNFDEKSQRNKIDDLVYVEEWGKKLEEGDKVKFSDAIAVLEMARLAPSWANEQPWKIIISEKKFHLFVKSFSIRHASLNPHRIDSGIIMYYIEELAKVQGGLGRWSRDKLTEDHRENYTYISSFTFEQLKT